MTKEPKIAEFVPGGLLAAELKRMEETSISAYLKSLESQTLSISSALAAQRAETHAAVASIGQLHSAGMEALASDLRNTIQLAESNVASAASAISLAHSTSIAGAMRLHEATSAAHALRIREALEHVRGSLDLTAVYRQARESLNASRRFEQIGSALDFTKHTETAAKSIIESLNLQTGAATLNLRSMFEEVRARTALSMVSTGHSGAASALDLSAVREVVEEVVQRYVPKPGEPAAATTEGSVVPADYPWDALLKPLGWRALIILLSVWVLGATFEAWLHVEVDRFMKADDPAARNQIVMQVFNDFGRESADALRCSRVILSIRKEPSTEAPIVGHLSVGQPVEVVYSEGPFSLIHYRDPGSDVIHEGWAASGFLVKYVPPGSGGKGSRKK